MLLSEVGRVGFVSSLKFGIGIFIQEVKPTFFCIFLGVKKKTEVIKDELNPVWNEVSSYFLTTEPLMRY